MSFLTTQCETCGTVEVPLHQAVLRVVESDASGCCLMACPSCARRLAVPVDSAMMVLLTTVGIECSVWPDHPSEEHCDLDLAPISHADLEAFRAVLSDEAQIAEQMFLG